jgi:hypothetical protein
MPSVDWNLSTFDGDFDWAQTGGEEWSAPWGGSEPQWFGCLYPRLHRFLPAGAVLEIAPGFGRWTRFLLPACRHYLGVDLSAECVEACRKKFSAVRHARFAKNDGLSLSAAPDGGIDFVFSFDALVHVEMDVMESYVPQILRKLTPTGTAFLHHSNLAALSPGVEREGFRGASVSGALVADMVQRAGGKVLIQERVNWGGPDLLDCLTLLARHGHPHCAPAVIVDNSRFMEEAAINREIHAPYCAATAAPALGAVGRPMGPPSLLGRWSAALRSRSARPPD